MAEIIKVDIAKFDPNPYQPRSRVEVTPETAEHYGKSILEHGLLQTPLARQAPFGKKGEKYQMGDGWLRLQGFKWLLDQGNLGFAQIPVDIREMNDEQMAQLVFEANGVRKDLDPIEKAHFFKTYMDNFKVSETQLAAKLSISQGEVANTLRLLSLPAEVRTLVAEGKVSQTHARHLVRLNTNPEKQAEIAQQVVKGGVSVKELSKKIDTEKGIPPKNRAYEDNTGVIRDGNGDVVKNGVPCETCGSVKECHQEFFYAAEKGGGYLCDRKTPLKTDTAVLAPAGPQNEPSPPQSRPSQITVIADTDRDNLAASYLIFQDNLNRLGEINSSESLQHYPPQLSGFFEYEGKLYVCVQTGKKDDAVTEAICNEVILVEGFKGLWGTYKGKEYVLTGRRVRFVPDKRKSNNPVF